MHIVDMELLVFSQPDEKSVALRDKYIQTLLDNEYVSKVVSYPEDKWEFSISTSKRNIHAYMSSCLSTDISQMKKGKQTQIIFVYHWTSPSSLIKTSSLISHLGKSSPVYVVSVGNCRDLAASGERYYPDTLSSGGGSLVLTDICRHCLDDKEVHLSYSPVATTTPIFDKEWLAETIKRLQILHDSL